jgi:hypothetical protein
MFDKLFPPHKLDSPEGKFYVLPIWYLGSLFIMFHRMDKHRDFLEIEADFLAFIIGLFLLRICYRVYIRQMMAYPKFFKYIFLFLAPFLMVFQAVMTLIYGFESDYSLFSPIRLSDNYVEFFESAEPQKLYGTILSMQIFTASLIKVYALKGLWSDVRRYTCEFGGLSN